MLAKRIIPCLDTRNGVVVKGVKFSNLREVGDPATLAKYYEDQEADEIVLLDISATPEGRNTALETVRRVRLSLSIPLTVGGGVRCEEDAEKLLQAGADKVGVNTQAVTDPSLVKRIAERFGRQCTVLALDARKSPSGWEVVTHSGHTATGLDALSWAKQAQELGAGEILLTSWDKDGTRSGYDLDLIREISRHANIPIIASGGAASPEHLLDAFRAGADAVLAASIFHDGDYTVKQIKNWLLTQGIPLRH